MTYPQALQQLQCWLTNSQFSYANHLNFNAYPLLSAELQAIREYTKNRLPESYYLFWGCTRLALNSTPIPQDF